MTHPEEQPAPRPLRLETQVAPAPESVELLSGGMQAYPRMLAAIAAARSSIYLEVYLFAKSGIGARFLDALSLAAERKVSVRVVIDGWGSARGGRAVAAALQLAGCEVHIHNRLLALLVGRLGRNHRKLLLVDDEVAFLGGINIDNVNLSSGTRAPSADLAVEIRGPQCTALGRRVRGEPERSVESALRIHLSGPGGGWRLRRRYLRAFKRARRDIYVAHGYFIPDRRVVRALTAAARRGTRVHLLLAGQENHLLIRSATRSLYRQLLAAGIAIYEWQGSLLHAKVAIVDSEKLLIGSFNLDRFSLANLETLVEVTRLPAVYDAQEWVSRHIANAQAVSTLESSTWRRRWILDPLGRAVAMVAEAIRRITARRRIRRARADAPPDVPS